MTDTAYAVNQQSEHIIFEVEDGFVTAHVLIRYVGDPAKFAWIVPVPAVPEMELTESILFGFLDQGSASNVFFSYESICPSPEYVCRHHPQPECGELPSTGSGTTTSGTYTTTGTYTSGSGGAGMGSPEGVVVVKKEQVGSYEVVVIAAGDGAAAVKWLDDNGFIVNDTMTPYMQGYVEAKMLFVAAKLVPGAGAEEIKPLKMRYAADNPMIPLRLTAVAAEPHLTVTSYIMADQVFAPKDHPLVEVTGKDLSVDSKGRSNYPMVLSRLIDDAGRDAFVREYAGPVPFPDFVYDPCCDDYDSCFASGDGICQCPQLDWDGLDCADQPELVKAIAILSELAAKHSTMTRLTTRLSPEEMTFDPGFTADASAGRNGALKLSRDIDTLYGCEEDVIDMQAYDDMRRRQDCASVYCGSGECVITKSGPGCRCFAGYTARTFDDLDGKRSVTCVPQVGTVDFAHNGIVLPDACAGVTCGSGSCRDVNGFPACDCEGSAGGAVGAAGGVWCSSIEMATGGPGARDYTAGIDKLAVCAPPPPESCGEWGWLATNPGKVRQGVVCASSVPADPRRFEVPPKPTCGDLGLPPLDGEETSAVVASGGGCGCIVTGDDDVTPLALLALMSLGGAGACRRSRGARRRR